MKVWIGTSHMIYSRFFTLFLIIFLSLWICGCTSIPGRFQKAVHINDSLGYVIEKEDDKGFYLETFYHEHSFFPNPDKAIENARDYFLQLASDIALEKERKINTIVKSSLNANATRNIIDGRYSVYVTGRVEYK